MNTPSAMMLYHTPSLQVSGPAVLNITHGNDVKFYILPPLERNERSKVYNHISFYRDDTRTFLISPSFQNKMKVIGGNRVKLILHLSLIFTKNSIMN